MTNVTVTTPAGQYSGEIAGRDPERREVQVMVRRETAPEWFREKYKSRAVFLWVRESEVRHN
jgi:hypothetical protein